MSPELLVANVSRAKVQPFYTALRMEVLDHRTANGQGFHHATTPEKTQQSLPCDSHPVVTGRMNHYELLFWQKLPNPSLFAS
jgi:hypothetical protein